jgi:hypothetical protein
MSFPRWLRNLRSALAQPVPRQVALELLAGSNPSSLDSWPWDGSSTSGVPKNIEALWPGG